MTYDFREVERDIIHEQNGKTQTIIAMPFPWASQFGPGQIFTDTCFSEPSQRGA